MGSSLSWTSLFSDRRELGPVGHCNAESKLNQAPSTFTGCRQRAQCQKIDAMNFAGLAVSSFVC